jgi:RNA polymerase sigma factor (TIGR02999 family)
MTSVPLPAPSGPAPLTTLLQAWQQGDRPAMERVLREVHAELLRMAGSRLRGGETPSLAREDLVSEALLRVLQSPPQWQNRSHFFATLSMTMRSVLVDHARSRQADKRGGGWQRVTYTLSAQGEESTVADLLTLDALLDRLAGEDRRAAEILQLTYFSGLQRDEIATVLELSVPTIDRELRFARAWLADQLGRPIEA